MTEWERPQYILANGKRAFVVLSVGQYELLIDALEDASDLAEMERRRDEETVPEHVVSAIIDGENPVRVWRLYRGISQAELSRRAGYSPAYVSDIEKGRTEGSVRAFKAIARALDVDLEEVVPRD
jgi:ribosome-binding protein aMBF1 (putative translation factor)